MLEPGTQPRLVEWAEELFRYYAQERAARLEGNWHLAYDAFRSKYSSENLRRWRALEGSAWRSTVFVRLTKIKIVSAVSQVNELLGSGNPWSINPTSDPHGMDDMPLPDAEVKRRASEAERVISADLLRGGFIKALRSSVLENAIYGTSALQAPIVSTRQQIGYRREMPGLAKVLGLVMPGALMDKYARHVPVRRTVETLDVENPSIWDLFWDPEAEDPQKGEGLFHRVMMSPSMLRRLATAEGYDARVIEQVIEESNGTRNGATAESQRPSHSTNTLRRRTIRVLAFWGEIPIEYLNRSEDTRINLSFSENNGRTIEGRFVIANGRIISKPVSNPHPSGQRPYHFAQWEKVPHEIGGVGIGENMQDSQTMVNGLARCFLDNKALSSNVLLSVVEGFFAPGETGAVYPGKTFRFDQLPDGDVRKALQFFVPPDATAGIIEGINLFERFADAESGIPNLSHGESAKFDPKTAFGTARALENGTRQLGETIRNIDEGQIEPVVTAYYHWLMATHPDESLKGDMECRARGFATFQNKVQESQNLELLLQYSLSNQLLTSLTKVPDLWREIWRRRGYRSDEYTYTDRELEALAANLGADAPKPPPEIGEDGNPIEPDDPGALPPEMAA